MGVCLPEQRSRVGAVSAPAIAAIPDLERRGFEPLTSAVRRRAYEFEYEEGRRQPFDLSLAMVDSARQAETTRDCRRLDATPARGLKSPRCYRY